MTTEARRGKVNWHQAFAEVALIVLGILGALAVDSWWEERSEREAEVDYLQSLKADFISTRDSLNKEIERAIGDRRLRPKPFVTQTIKNGIGAKCTMFLQKHLQNLAPNRSQTQPVLFAMRFS